VSAENRRDPVGRGAVAMTEWPSGAFWWIRVKSGWLDAGPSLGLGGFSAPAGRRETVGAGDLVHRVAQP
jgi:hypothetical protein